MLLPPDEGRLFFKLHRTLMVFVNQQLHVLPDVLSAPDDFAHQPPESRFKIRNALLDKIDLIDSFATANPAQLSEQELDIVLSWKQFIRGHFYIFRKLKKCTVFLSSEDDPIAYGVTALSQPFEELVGPYLPVMTETVLLPFKDKIVYDGMLVGPGVSLSFGPGIRRMLHKSYEKAKDRYGIVTSLPIAELSVSLTKTVKAKKKPPMVRQTDDSQAVLGLILAMIDEFCRDHLNDEYAALCRKLAEKLSRKRPSPLLRGKPNVWACGIIRTIGMVNFLSDRSQKPSMKLTDIDQAFVVGESTASAKSAAIRKMLKIHRFYHEWILPSRLDDNPLVWMLTVNGIAMDIRDAPREAQEVAFEKGLIPYIPADRAEEE